MTYSKEAKIIGSVKYPEQDFDAYLERLEESHTNLKSSTKK